MSGLFYCFTVEKMEVEFDLKKKKPYLWPFRSPIFSSSTPKNT